MTDLQRDQIKRMRLQGISYAKISQQLDLPDNTVRSFCRRNGLGEKPKNTVNCKQCGKHIEIVPKQKPRLFCSTACRAAWWNGHLENVNRKAFYSFTCANCGKAFTAYGNKERKYCNHRCYLDHRFGRESGSCE